MWEKRHKKTGKSSFLGSGLSTGKNPFIINYVWNFISEQYRISM